MEISWYLTLTDDNFVYESIKFNEYIDQLHRRMYRLKKLKELFVIAEKYVTIDSIAKSILELVRINCLSNE